MKSRLGSLEAELSVIRREASGWNQERFEKESSDWAGRLSETWERLLSSEVVGRVVDRNTMEVRPKMLKILARLTAEDDKEFQESYGRISRWARRHDKSLELNYVAPTVDEMKTELDLVRQWYERVRKYANGSLGRVSLKGISLRGGSNLRLVQRRRTGGVRGRGYRCRR